MIRRFCYCFLLLTFQPLAAADLATANAALSRGDNTAAFKEFQQLANAGDAKAQANLGYMYYIGEGVAQNYEQAVAWYRKAASQGDRDAQYNLAVAYAFGEGVKQDNKEASQWYRRAADQGHILAQYSLGISYSFGEGVKQDSTEAVKWFRAAADQGYERAQVQLGSKYHTGDGVAQDYAQAAAWYRKAADRGNAAAQYNLGTLYRSGRGVEQDYNQALRWFRMAADQGYAAAQNELASMERAISGAVRSNSRPDLQPAPSRPQPTAAPGPTVATSTPATTSAAPAGKSAEEPVASRTPLFSVNSADLLTVDKPVATVATEQPANNELLSPDTSATATSGAQPLQADDLLASGKKSGTETAPAETSAPLAEPPAQDNTRPRGFFSRLFGQGNNGQEHKTEAAIVDKSTTAAVTTATETTTPIAAATASTTEAGNASQPTVAEAPKPGLFSRIFGKHTSTDTAKTETTTTVDSTVAVTEPAAVPPTTATATEPVTAPTATTAETEPSSSSTAAATDSAKPQTEEPKQGFLGRLLGNRSKSQAESTAQPAQAEPADNAAAATATAAESTATTSEQARPGFFKRLFGSKEQKEAAPVVAAAEPAATAPAATVAAAEPEKSTPAVGTADVTRARDDLVPLSEPGRTTAATEPTTPAAAGPEAQPGKDATAGEDTGGGFFRNLFRRRTSSDSKTTGDTVAMAEQPDQALHANAAEAAQQTLASPNPTPADPAALQAARNAYDNKHYEEAFVLYRPLAVTGDPLAQYVLATMYHQGLGVTQNYTDALYWYRQAAQSGNVEAQYSLGNLYLMGEGVKQDDTQAASWYEKAAAQGHEPSRHNLANIRKVVAAAPNDIGQVVPGDLPADAEGYKVPKEEKKSGSGFLKNLFGRKESEAAATTAKPEAIPAPPPEPKQAAKPAEAKQGGFGRQSGNKAEPPEPSGTAQDSADQTAETPATGPEPEKKGFFSRIFGKDKSTNQEATVAVAEQPKTMSPEVAKQVAEIQQTENSKDQPIQAAGSARANYEKGLTYQYGDGVAADSAMAFQLYMQAAEQDYAPAQYKVGAAYAYGEGVAKNQMEAARWYNRAARQGYAMAQRNLGVMYLNGEGVDQNKLMALAWYSVLADHGNVTDVRRRDLLAQDMSDQDKQEAMRVRDGLLTEIQTKDK